MKQSIIQIKRFFNTIRPSPSDEKHLFFTLKNRCFPKTPTTACSRVGVLHSSQGNWCSGKNRFFLRACGPISVFSAPKKAKKDEGKQNTEP